MNKPILKIEDNIEKLTQRCEEIEPILQAAEIQQILSKLKETLKANDFKLASLAASQLNYKYRIFGINFKGKIHSFINPMITSSKGFHWSREIDQTNHKEYIIPRCDEITAIYQTEKGKTESNKFIGIAGDIFQQNINLLDGSVVSDIGLEILPGFDGLSEAEKLQILSLYKNSLNNKFDNLNEEINNTPILKQTKDAIDYLKTFTIDNDKDIQDKLKNNKTDTEQNKNKIIA